MGLERAHFTCPALIEGGEGESQAGKPQGLAGPAYLTVIPELYQELEAPDGSN